MKHLYTGIAGVFLLSIQIFGYDFNSFNSQYQNSDYYDALSMTLKFMGGQRCGDNHNWMLHENQNTGNTCHLMDGQGQWYISNTENGSETKSSQASSDQYDLTGGWHDCGDHIKVATTMGYAAVCLLAAYDIWPGPFQDNYDKEYGSANGIPDVLDEVKHATDYFMKSFPDDTTFVYYVGNGSYDHKVWCTSSYQSDLPVKEGGDPRPIYTTSTLGGPWAANYASALALMAIHYPDNTYAQECQEMAVKAYNYAEANPKPIAIPEFYPSPNDATFDELGLAAILLFKLTGDSEYKEKALNFFQGKWESNSPLAWDTIADLAYYYILQYEPEASNGEYGTLASFITKNVMDLYIVKGEESENGFPYFSSTWGTNKLASGASFGASLFIKLNQQGIIDTSVAKAENFSRRMVDYMLGDNEFDHTFIHGYKGDTHFKVHHRNAMGRNDNPPDEEKETSAYMFKSGALIGGPQAYGDFNNSVVDYVCTESGCDYNAPLIAALAGVLSRTDSSSVEPELSGNSRLSRDLRVEYNDKGIILSNIPENLNNIRIVSLSGRLVKEINYGTGIEKSESLRVSVSDIPDGVYIIKSNAFSRRVMLTR